MKDGFKPALRVSFALVTGYGRNGAHVPIYAGHVPYSEIKDAAGYRVKRSARAALAAFQAKRDKRRAIIVARWKSTFPTRIR